MLVLSMMFPMLLCTPAVLLCSVIFDIAVMTGCGMAGKRRIAQLLQLQWEQRWSVGVLPLRAELNPTPGCTMQGNLSLLICVSMSMMCWLNVHSTIMCISNAEHGFM